MSRCMSTETKLGAFGAALQEETNGRHEKARSISAKKGGRIRMFILVAFNV